MVHQSHKLVGYHYFLSDFFYQLLFESQTAHVFYITHFLLDRAFSTNNVKHCKRFDIIYLDGPFLPKTWIVCAVSQV